MGKWRWRFYKERDRLWAKVVESCFGLGCREGMDGGSSSSGGRFLGWWGEVREMFGGGDEGWFAEGMMKVVGDGGKTSFWDERWVGDVCFRRKFYRLYNLSEDKEKMVGEMGEWVGEEWRWKWAWRRELFDREVVRLNELISILDRSHIKRGVQDTWRWDMTPDGLYTIRDVYAWLSCKESEEAEDAGSDSGFDLIWNKFSPLKVIIHAWRLLWERLPTTTKLQRRNALPSSADMNCVFCTCHPESVRHIFFECKFSYFAWMECCGWLGFQSVLSSDPTINLLYFSKLLRGKRGKTAVVCIWECVAWTLWKWRNNVVFRNAEVSVGKVMDDIISRLWSWLVVKDSRCNNFIFEDWRANPRMVLDC
ncbi:hypothetical protein ACS0TY_000522 [Phlomoides rotata]